MGEMSTFKSYLSRGDHGSHRTGGAHDLAKDTNNKESEMVEGQERAV